MKTIVAILAIVAAANAHAISRYNSKSLTCSEARQILKDEGAVIFRYPSTRVPGLTLYDRYVASSRYCSSGEQTQWASIPTQDNSKCRVYKCRQHQGR